MNFIRQFFSTETTVTETICTLSIGIKPHRHVIKSVINGLYKYIRFTVLSA